MAHERAAPDIRGIAFVKYLEVKHGTDPKRHYFYLLDAAGRQFHAGTAEDQGGAHYAYTSVPPFDQMYQSFTGTNKKDMVMWLEMMMKQSQVASGIQTEIPHLGEPTAENPFGTFFLSYRQVKEQLHDGRHCHKWLLKDQHGQEHLAVVGEEMLSRDGHYQYSAEEPFASRYPLNVSNQSGVLHWIESMLTHLAPPGIKLDMVQIRQEATRGSSEGARGPTATHAAAATAAKASPASPTARASGSIKHKGGRGSKHRLSGAAMESVKRARRPLEEQQAIAATPGTGPAAEASKAPTALQLAAQAHRSAAAAEAAQRELLRSTTLCWLQGAASEDEGDVLKQWGATLRQLWQDAHKDVLQPCQLRPLVQQPCFSVLAQAPQPHGAYVGELGAPATVQTFTYSDMHNQQHGVRLVLECLREVGSICPPVQCLVETGVVDTVRLYCGHPHPTVASLAQRIMARWQRRALAAVTVLMDPVYCEDPILQVDTIIMQREEIAKEVTAAAMLAQSAGASQGGAALQPGAGDALGLGGEQSSFQGQEPGMGAVEPMSASEAPSSLLGWMGGQTPIDSFMNAHTPMWTGSDGGAALGGGLPGGGFLDPDAQCDSLMTMLPEQAQQLQQLQQQQQQHVMGDSMAYTPMHLS